MYGVMLRAVEMGDLRPTEWAMRALTVVVVAVAIRLSAMLCFRPHMVLALTHKRFRVE